MPPDKRCPDCGVTRPSSDYYRCASRPDGLQGICKPCKADRARDRMRKKPRAYSTADRARSRAYAERNRHKIKARKAVYHAVRKGELIRPDECPSCGTAGKVTAHHSDYSRPLDVRWMCHECHGREHRSPLDTPLDTTAPNAAVSSPS